MSLSMMITRLNGSHVGVLEQNKVSICGLWQRTADPWKRRSSLVVLDNLSHQALGWKLVDQKLGGLLVSIDLTKATVRFLDCICEVS